MATLLFEKFPLSWEQIQLLHDLDINRSPYYFYNIQMPLILFFAIVVVLDGPRFSAGTLVSKNDKEETEVEGFEFRSIRFKAMHVVLI